MRYSYHNDPNSPTHIPLAEGHLAHRRWALSRLGQTFLISISEVGDGSFTFEIDRPQQGIALAEAILSACGVSR